MMGKKFGPLLSGLFYPVRELGYICTYIHIYIYLLLSKKLFLHTQLFRTATLNIGQLSNTQTGFYSCLQAPKSGANGLKFAPQFNWVLAALRRTEKTECERSLSKLVVMMLSSSCGSRRLCCNHDVLEESRSEVILCY